MFHIRIYRALILLTALTAPLSQGAEPPYRVYESESDFDTLMEAAKLAIQERGLYINKIMHMSDMLRRTGKALGVQKAIYERAESIEFCSAVLSRKMTRENPARLVNCPFILAIYTLPEQPGKTFLAYRAIPQAEIEGSEAMRAVAEMLDGVAEEAVNW